MTLSHAARLLVQLAPLRLPPVHRQLAPVPANQQRLRRGLVHALARPLAVQRLVQAVVQQLWHYVRRTRR